MEIVHKYLERCAWTVVFVSALSLTLHLYSSLNSFIDVQKLVIFDRGDGVVTSRGDITNETSGLITYSELIGIMMNGIELDICIDDNFIYASSFSPYLFNFTTIKQSEFYKRTYVYDKYGEISYVNYSSNY